MRVSIYKNFRKSNGHGMTIPYLNVKVQIADSGRVKIYKENTRMPTIESEVLGTILIICQEG